MGDPGRISLTRLSLLWAAVLSLCSVSLENHEILAPVVLLASVLGCLALIVGGRDPRVWWVYAAVLSVTALGLGFVPFWVFAQSRLTGGWLPYVAVIYAVVGTVTALAPWRHRSTYAAFMLIHIVLVGILLHELPVVSDVRSLVDGSADALLRGVHPYGITVPAVYVPELDWIYGPGVLVDGRITYGYPYLPVPLLVVLPAYVLGDIRFALVLAMILTSWLIRRMASDQLGRLCAVLVLMMPVSWATQLSFWIEPVMLLWIALMAFAMVKGTSRAALWFGMFLASKQFAVVHLPLLWTLFRAGGRKAVLVALIVPAVLCSIFLVWDPAAFYHSAVDFHLRQPYRPDTVTVTPALERLFGGHPAFLDGPYGFALGAAVSALLAWRWRPGPAMISAAVGLSLAVSVLFSKQGHTNYWALIGGCLLVAVATWGRVVPEPPDSLLDEATDPRRGARVSGG